MGGTRKDLVNDKTPEVTGEEMQQAYDSDKLIKKLLKEDFRKRNRKHRKSLKNNTNPIKIIITTLGLISLIYAATFIIMKSAKKTEIRKLTIQSAKNTEPNNIKAKEYEPDLEKINEKIGKQRKNVKYYTNKRSQPIPQKTPDLKNYTGTKKVISVIFKRKKR